MRGHGLLCFCKTLDQTGNMQYNNLKDNLGGQRDEA